MFKDKPFNPPYTLLMVIIHIAALGAVFVPFRIEYFYLAVFHYLWFGLASSLYYHRCLTHRAFELKTPLHVFFLLGSLVGLAGDPINWVAIHRYHHGHSDQVDDIHSPKDGWLYAYFLWFMRADMVQIGAIGHYAKDLNKFWFIRAARGIWPGAIAHGAYAFGIWSIWGFPGVLVGFYLPLALSYHFCWMLIAFLCHLPQLGTRRAETDDESRNIWWLGLPTFGESLHNNHHENPRRVRFGFRWFEIDLTAAMVVVLEKLGLATQVIRDPPKDFRSIS